MFGFQFTLTTDLTFMTNEYGANLSDRFAALIKYPDYPKIPQKQIQVKPLEKQIDQLVYKLYDLTPEEIQIVEGFNEGK